MWRPSTLCFVTLKCIFFFYKHTHTHTSIIPIVRRIRVVFFNERLMILFGLSQTFDACRMSLIRKSPSLVIIKFWLAEYRYGWLFNGDYIIFICVHKVTIELNVIRRRFPARFRKIPVVHDIKTKTCGKWMLAVFLTRIRKRVLSQKKKTQNHLSLLKTIISFETFQSTWKGIKLDKIIVFWNSICCSSTMVNMYKYTL